MWRIFQAAKIKTGNNATVIINSYFPQDPRTQTFDESELIETLECIKNVMENNPFSHFLWAGDINVDFSRNNGQSLRINNYLEEFGLGKSWEKYEVDFTCCHEMNGVAHVCTIDHFFWNEAMNDLVEDAGVLHLVDNQSDHCPIYCVLNTAGFETVSQKRKISPPKPSWKKATQQQKDKFKTNLEEQLLK